MSDVINDEEMLDIARERLEASFKNKQTFEEKRLATDQSIAASLVILAKYSVPVEVTVSPAEFLHRTPRFQPNPGVENE